MSEKASILNGIKVRILSLKCILLFAFLVVGVAFIGVLVSDNHGLKTINTKLNEQLSLKKAGLVETEADKVIIVPADFRIFPSPNGKYILVLKATPDIGEDLCDVEVYDSQGDIARFIDLKKLVGIENVSCGSGMFGLSSNELLGWHDDNTFSFKIGEFVYVVSLINEKSIENGGSVSTYGHSSKNLRPLDLNKRYELFLFSDNSQDRLTDRLVFIDLKNNKTIKELTFEKGALDSPVYDRLNDGYVFSQRLFSENSVETKIYFLNLENFTTRLLLQENKEFLGGRGCGPYRARSTKKGEVIFDPGGCLILNQNRFSNDGYLHFNI